MLTDELSSQMDGIFSKAGNDYAGHRTQDKSFIACISGAAGQLSVGRAKAIPKGEKRRARVGIHPHKRRFARHVHDHRPTKPPLS
ncbi:hypothetical protein SISSUDRAFT_377754 [Sistotremastrum suecicum HHB10207 ss-3]|uniref:Uncharacterized protein n=1 Tax=Sistotremastrum suecicum HHB10207 ss-3 TaxID=1314776 RepID=A0A165Z1N8_9AGAM|nr:hypothetical protein SISSUDRAFT_377754 [Sistotremastrum suecicum HHB10207 ss-3]